MRCYLRLLHDCKWSSAFIFPFTHSAWPSECARCVCVCVCKGFFVKFSTVLYVCQCLSALMSPLPSHFTDSVGFESLTNLHLHLSHSGNACTRGCLSILHSSLATSYLIGYSGVILVEWHAGWEWALIRMAVNPCFWPLVPATTFQSS